MRHPSINPNTSDDAHPLDCGKRQPSCLPASHELGPGSRSLVRLIGNVATPYFPSACRLASLPPRPWPPNPNRSFTRRSSAGNSGISCCQRPSRIPGLACNIGRISLAPARPTNSRKPTCCRTSSPTFSALSSATPAPPNHLLVTPCRGKPRWWWMASRPMPYSAGSDRTGRNFSWPSKERAPAIRWKSPSAAGKCPRSINATATPSISCAIGSSSPPCGKSGSITRARTNKLTSASIPSAWPPMPACSSASSSCWCRPRGA